MKRHLDLLDKKILNIISKNARVPFLEVARECGVSGAAIHQRVQKLIGCGVIKGSEFIVDTYKIGYQTCAYIGINISDMTYYKNVITAIEAIPEVVECHATTGRYVLLIKIFAKNNRHLGSILIDKIVAIKGVTGTETLQVSLEEILRRQIDRFDYEDYDYEDFNDADSEENFID
jgi:Lrp/AsnC family transcriptional regulator for asnA, asnC and gidA